MLRAGAIFRIQCPARRTVLAGEIARYTVLDRSTASRPSDARNVCVNCFVDDDLKKVIWRHRGKGRYAFCGSRGVAVMPLHDMVDYL